jgi:hypothetical protein
MHDRDALPGKVKKILDRPRDRKGL